MSWNSNLVGKAIYYQLRGLCSGKVYPAAALQDVVAPYITYTVVSTRPDYTKDSASVADKLRVQIDILDPTYSGACATAMAVRDLLDFVSGTIAGVPVNTIRFEDEMNMFEDEVLLHRITQDYYFRIPNDITMANTVNTAVIEDVGADYTAIGVIPAGYMVAAIIFDNSTANTAQLSAGSTAGSNDIFSTEVINASRFTTISVNKTFSTTLSTSIYFNHAGDGDTWNGITATIYILLTKIS